MGYFLVFFATMWLGITTLLGHLSGWYCLMRQYPDKAEVPLLALSGQSGSMGSSVGINGILRLGVCASGLRVGILRIFGLFSRDFFVPWSEITISRKTSFFRDTAELNFGSPSAGHLAIPAAIANRLAAAARESWPEMGPLPVSCRRATARSFFKIWIIQTVLSSAFFIIVARLAALANVRPPVLVAILFPALVFGVVAVFQHWKMHANN